MRDEGGVPRDRPIHAVAVRSQSKDADQANVFPEPSIQWQAEVPQPQHFVELEGDDRYRRRDRDLELEFPERHQLLACRARDR